MRSRCWCWATCRPLAAEPGAAAAAGGPAELAARRRLHPDVQRADDHRARDRAGGDGDGLPGRQVQRLHPRRRQARGVPRLRRRGRLRLHHPRQQLPRQGRQPQRGDDQDRRRVHPGVRLRPHPDAGVPATDDRLAGRRPAAGDGADAAPFLFARPVPAEPRRRHPRAGRGQHVLRPRAGRQRLLERRVLLRLVRDHPAPRAGVDRRLRGRDRHRRRAYRC